MIFRILQWNWKRIKNVKCHFLKSIALHQQMRMTLDFIYNRFFYFDIKNGMIW
jgi:hypothetical protein